MKAPNPSPRSPLHFHPFPRTSPVDQLVVFAHSVFQGLFSSHGRYTDLLIYHSTERYASSQITGLTTGSHATYSRLERKGTEGHSDGD